MKQFKISLLVVMIITLVTSCKKENVLKKTDSKDYQTTNMKMDYYGEQLEYTVKFNPKTNDLRVEGKDAERVKEIINSHPNALASVKCETEFTFYNHKNEFYNEEEKHFQEKSHSRIVAEGDLATVNFYRDVNYVNLSRTAIINQNIKYSFAQYEPCNAADNWCATGSYLYRSGVKNPWVGNSENDSYSSIRITGINVLGVPVNTTIRVILHEDINYGGGAIQFQLYSNNNVLNGIPNLKNYKNNIFLKTWNDRASSYQCYLYDPVL